MALKDGELVDRNGITVILKRTALYRIDTSGSEAYLPASTTFTLEVGGAPSVAISGGRSSSSGALIFKGKARPRFTAKLKPALSGRTLHVVVQRRTKTGHWVKVSDTTCRQSAKGSCKVAFTGKVVRGRAYRVRTVWKGDASVLSGHSDWSRFRFTA